MRNPIGKFKREKLEKIDREIESFKEQFNLMTVKIDSFDLVKEQLNAIYETLTYEPSPEELKEQEKDAINQVEDMKLIVRGAITDLYNDPENQKSIQEFIDKLMGGMKGAKQGQDLFGMSWEQLQNQEGDLDIVKAGFALWNNMKGKGSSGSATVSSGGKGPYS